jgi:hypothetical protein
MYQLPSASLSGTPLFISTARTSRTYCNVTGIQRAKALNDGRVVSDLRWVPNLLLSQPSVQYHLPGNTARIGWNSPHHRFICNLSLL